MVNVDECDVMRVWLSVAGQCGASSVDVARMVECGALHIGSVALGVVESGLSVAVGVAVIVECNVQYGLI